MSARCWCCDAEAPRPGYDCETCGSPHCAPEDEPCTECRIERQVDAEDHAYEVERDRRMMEGR